MTCSAAAPGNILCRDGLWFASKERAPSGTSTLRRAAQPSRQHAKTQVKRLHLAPNQILFTFPCSIPRIIHVISISNPVHASFCPKATAAVTSCIGWQGQAPVQLLTALQYCLCPLPLLSWDLTRTNPALLSVVSGGRYQRPFRNLRGHDLTDSAEVARGTDLPRAWSAKLVRGAWNLGPPVEVVTWVGQAMAGLSGCVNTK
ncbi:hypothetical protein VTK56DRAFT_3604 [Thermocarpiscus australiensis]